MPKESFSHKAVSSAPRQEAWRALDRPETWEGVAGVDRVIDPLIDAQGRLRSFSFETMIGGRGYRGRAVAGQRIDGSRMSWDIDSSELRGVIAVDLEDQGDQTLVTVKLEVESVGMLSSILFPAIASALNRGLPDTAEDFARRLANSN